MAEAEEFGKPAPEHSPNSGLPEGLAELAALGLHDDWSALPHPLLGDIFRRLLEQYTSVEDIVRAWQSLALVCKGWQASLRTSTPLCLELTKPGHLSPDARRWLSHVPMEVVVLARTLPVPPGADLLLLSGPTFRRHSASVLRSLMHISPDAAPLLHNFAKLKQVALYCSDEQDHGRAIDASLLHQLPKLNCLTVAGFWGSLDTAQLPTRLKHLALSNYNEAFSLDVVLPEGMKQLELLSVRADGVVLDWVDVCQRCEEVHVAAHAVVLRVGLQPVPALIRDVGLDNLQTHMYKRVGAAMTDGEHFQEATLAFFNLMLSSGPLDRGVIPIDADDFLQTLRDDLLPTGVDVNPALEVFPEFVRDTPSPEACFVLELVKQEAGKPKSLHFTTPVTDAEVRLLTSQPVWRISWCEDPRAAQVLADPQFVAQSAGTLTDLLSIPLVPELDLRPFRKLLSVLGLLRCAADELAGVLRRMPRGLESLCLTAEGVEEQRNFDAELVLHLRHLREVSLYGHRRHNFARLRRSVNMIRILNPAVQAGEVIGRGGNFCWPERGEDGSESGDDSGSESGASDVLSPEGEEGAVRKAGSAASADSFDSATSEMRSGSSCGGSPLAPKRGGGSGGDSAAAAAVAAAAQEAAGPKQEAAIEQAAEAVAAEGGGLAEGSVGVEVGKREASEASGSCQTEGGGGGTQEAAVGTGAAAGQAAAAGPAGLAAADPAASGAEGTNNTSGAAADDGNADADDDAASVASSGEVYEDAEHGGHGSHSHGGRLEDDRHSKQACQDAFCPLHSGKSFLQISLTDDRQLSSIDFSALLAAGFRMITLTLSAEHPDAHCLLLHEGSWRSALAALESSDIEVLELNCQAASMTFRSSSLLHRLTEVSVQVAMQYVAKHYSDTWQVKSWNGNTAADGVLEGSRGYALMRRSVLDAHTAGKDGGSGSGSREGDGGAH